MENTNAMVTTQEKNISDNVLNRVKVLEKEGSLQFPANYSYSNALKSAWLILQEAVDKNQKPVLQTCSKESIANALLDMVIQGLSPAKKQCYFVAFGGKLQLMRSYMGTIAVTKRLKGVKNVYANCIYEGDTFEFVLDLDTGLKKITKHETHFENIDPAKIKGAYAVIVMEDGNNYVEIMNIGQIRAAWNQGAARGGSGAHKNFTDEMAKKTVINRACKMFANTSDDSDLLINTFNNTGTDEKPQEGNLISNVDYEVTEEIKGNANTKPIDIETEEEPEVVQSKVEVTQGKQGQMTMMEGPGF